MAWSLGVGNPSGFKESAMLNAPDRKTWTRLKRRPKIVAEVMDRGVFRIDAEFRVIRKSVLADRICSDLKRHSLRKWSPEFDPVRTDVG